MLLLKPTDFYTRNQITKSIQSFYETVKPYYNNLDYTSHDL